MKIHHESITGLSGGMETSTPTEGKFRMEGDVSQAIADVKRSREAGRNKKSHYQHMCDIPPIVVVELLTKYHLDIMSDDFMHDSNNIKRLKYLLRTEYPDLLVMT